MTAAGLSAEQRRVLIGLEKDFVNDAIERFNRAFVEMSRAVRGVMPIWARVVSRMAYLVRRLPPEVRWQVGLALRPTPTLPRRSARHWRRR